MTNRELTIGLISPHWLPYHGGAEQYLHRMAVALDRKGVDMHVFCGTAAESTRYNGTFPVTRWTPFGNVGKCNWNSTIPRPIGLSIRESMRKRIRRKRGNRYQRICSLSKLRNVGQSPDDSVFRHHDFMDAAVQWACDLDLDIALIGSPLAETRQLQARELYLRLKAHGVKVGAIYHDLGKHVQHDLVRQYLHNGHNWQDAADTVSQAIDELSRKHNLYQVYSHINSPLLFDPDFVVSCSEWSGRFIDPANQIPKYVLHPLMDVDYWHADISSTEALNVCDILMVNPQSRKNPALLAYLIHSSQPGMSFRVIAGGWGDALGKFTPTVKSSRAYREQRIHFCDYLYDMRTAYRNSRILLFPSYAEGYGMTPVEALLSGTAVVSSNYPAVLEAVGDGAYTLCPYTDNHQTWRRAVNDVLNNLEYWREQGSKQAARVAQQEKDELDRLITFFGSVVGLPLTDSPSEARYASLAKA